MARTAFDLRLGTDQGRVQEASGYVAPDGSALFVLGSDTPKHFATLVPGDHAETFTDGTFDSANMVRLRARTRGPLRALEGDLAWCAQIRVDGVVVLEIPIDPKHTRTLGDLAVPVGQLAGVHELGFRLLLRGSIVPTADVEIPALYVDALVLDPAFVPRPQLTNRNPEPSEVGVAITRTIALDIVDVGTTGVNESATTIYVAGSVAFNGVSVLAPYNGPRSSVSVGTANTLRVTLDPIAGLPSQGVVPVRVVTAIAGGPTSDSSYSFTVEDDTPPSVVTVTGSDETKVRVVFSEAMDPSTLTAEAFAIARTVGEISVPVNAVSVATVSEVEVEITLDQEVTPNATYTLTASGVTDKAGNPVAAPMNIGTFAGYVCATAVARDWDLYSFMPALNRNEDEGDLAKFIAIIQELSDHMLCRIDRFTDVIDPDVNPATFLQAMLDDLGNPFVQENIVLTDTKRRQLAQTLVALFRQVGVAPGILGAIRFFLNLEVTLGSTAVAPLGLGDWTLGDTWILGTSDAQELFTFRIHTPRALTADERTRMATIVTFMKTEREFFKIIEPVTTLPPVEMANNVELGVSELGSNWLLH